MYDVQRLPTRDEDLDGRSLRELLGKNLEKIFLLVESEVVDRINDQEYRIGLVEPLEWVGDEFLKASGGMVVMYLCFPQ